jgi:hypothetical protein
LRNVGIPIPFSYQFFYLLCTMKNPTAKKARKTPRSKDAQRVDRVLGAIKAAPKEGDLAANFEILTGADVKDAMKVAKRATTLAKTGKRLALKTEAAKPEVTCGMLGKVRRAHVKAGIGEPTQGVLEAFARKLLTAGVPIMERSSTRIAKAIKGESEIAALK